MAEHMCLKSPEQVAAEVRASVLATSRMDVAALEERYRRNSAAQEMYVAKKGDRQDERAARQVANALATGLRTSRAVYFNQGGGGMPNIRVAGEVDAGRPAFVRGQAEVVPGTRLRADKCPENVLEALRTSRQLADGGEMATVRGDAARAAERHRKEIERGYIPRPKGEPKKGGKGKSKK